MKEEIYICDKCHKNFKEIKNGYQIGVEIRHNGSWKREEYHYCSEECYQKRFE